jgi:hypothetical protein
MLLLACDPTSTPTTFTSTSPTSTTTSNSGSTTGSTTPSTATTLPSTTAIGWDGNRVTYPASVIRHFGSGTPAGTTNYNASTETVAIWNIDASLDNYGGIQTPTLSLDFSKAVIFQMEVVSVYSQYIVKLAVAGESEYYYVLSDDGRTGIVSINVVDAMLSQKYREKNTQPDPGYASGWKYANQIKNCSFHILAKGPDGEKQTAELVIKSITITNDSTPITGMTIEAADLANNQLTKLKNAASISLTARVLPQDNIDQSVFWESRDESIATVNAEGLVAFIGVGVTEIVATSIVDQSKSTAIIVNVRSGYEDPSELRTRLAMLQYGGSAADVAAFADLFQTTWGASISQALVPSPSTALSSRYHGSTLLFENYFSANNAGHVLEATNRLVAGEAKLTVSLVGNGAATLYRNIDGRLVQERVQGTFQVAYAINASGWTKRSSYTEHGIVAWDNGATTKYEIKLEAATILASYDASMLANPAHWTIPDRTKQTIDPVIHALSPASIAVQNELAVLRQNKYPEAKYCFGGIASNLITALPGKDVQIVLDVTAINQLNPFVKTMWEIKIIYYQSNGTSVVSTNPLKLDSGNTAGVHTVTFRPAYANFRIYLVVNGSDIGAQFAGAEMQIRSLKIQMLDE